MPVDTPHSSYNVRALEWQMCRDCVDGELAVKLRGTEYLPRLSNQKDEDYRAMVKRATFYGAAARTVQGLVGMVYRKEPELKVPKVLEDALDTVAIGNLSFRGLSEHVTAETITCGRVGVLVDASSDDIDAMPYAALYFAENIVNWRREVVNGKSKLTLVVLRETKDVPKPDDPFESECRVVYRVLRLERTEGESPTYTVQLYVETSGNECTGGTGGKRSFAPEGDPIIPRRKGGRPLDFIPFQFFGVRVNNEDIEKPPILDLCLLNLSHYRNSSDLEHGLHFTALPTAWVAGFDAKDNTLSIGSATAWVTENESAKAGFLEFSGAGLSSIDKAMERKENRMAVLGARLLEEQKAEAETATTVTLRQAGEQSVLASIAMRNSEGLKMVLFWLADWMQPTTIEQITYTLSRDYTCQGLDSTTITALVAAWQGGALSYDDLFFNFKRGEVVAPNRTLEESKSLIATSSPVPPAGRAAPGGEDEERDDEDETGRGGTGG